jgi:hypothetical protein
MEYKMKKFSLLGMLMLTACVTINIYFPAAAAEKVADEIIKDIQGNTPQKPKLDPKPEPKSERSDFQTSFHKLPKPIYPLIARKSNSFGHQWRRVFPPYKVFIQQEPSGYKPMDC